MGAKSLTVAAAILEREKRAGRTVTPMKLIKLTYIAHGIHLGTFGTPLLDEKVEAWLYGPVILSIYHTVAGYGSRPVEAVKGAEDCETGLTAQERQVLDFVSREYGPESVFDLSSAANHEGGPWHTVNKQPETYGKLIPDGLIADFYRQRVLGKPHHVL